ncbi:MAG: BrnA antitoxin family protein [Rhodocyclaceae bacterium]
MSGNKRATPTNWVDPDDAPELTDEFFERADEYVGENLVRRGRPPVDHKKLLLTVRYDEDVVAAFKATGKGWQTRMNEALREWLKQHPQKAA